MPGSSLEVCVLMTTGETAALANYTCSVVWSPNMNVSSYTYMFIYSSPSNAYLVTPLLEVCTYPLSMFCVCIT